MILRNVGSISYRSTPCHIPEDLYLQLQCCENLKCRIHSNLTAWNTSFYWSVFLKCELWCQYCVLKLLRTPVRLDGGWVAPRACVDAVEARWPPEPVWTRWRLGDLQSLCGHSGDCVAPRACVDTVEVRWPPESVWTQWRQGGPQSLCGQSGGWVTPNVCVDIVEKTRISVLSRNSYRAFWEVN
jgi:hypothetical protein